MKNLLYLLLFDVVIACNSGNNQIDPRVLTVPAFNMQLLDSSRSFNTATISKGQPTLLMYFSPDCKYSHQQTRELLTHLDSLQSVNIYMCSSAPLQKLHDFSEHYHLQRHSNITVGRDVNLFFAEQLKVPGYPWLFMYTADKQLKRIATGFVEVRKIVGEIKGSKSTSS